MKTAFSILLFFTFSIISAQTNEKASKNKYNFMVDLGTDISLDEYSKTCLNANILNGILFQNGQSLNIGTGVIYEIDESVQIPLFLDYRIRSNDKKTSPMFIGEVGGIIFNKSSWKKGLFLKIGFGMDIKNSERFTSQLYISYKIQQAEVIDFSSGSFLDTEKKGLKSLGLNYTLVFN
jgi:hypothetical protein